MSNYRLSDQLRRLHDDGVCPEDACPHCARIEQAQAYADEPREGNYYMTVQDYPEPR